MIEAADYRSGRTRELVKDRAFPTQALRVETQPAYEIFIVPLGRGQRGAAGVGRAGLVNRGEWG